MIKQVNVLVDYYDISDELIEDKEFQLILDTYKNENLQLRINKNGFKTNKEWDNY